MSEAVNLKMNQSQNAHLIPFNSVALSGGLIQRKAHFSEIRRSNYFSFSGHDPESAGGCFCFEKSVSAILVRGESP